MQNEAMDNNKILHVYTIVWTLKPKIYIYKKNKESKQNFKKTKLFDVTPNTSVSDKCFHCNVLLNINK